MEEAKPKGRKYGGRQKGTPNKRTETIRQLFDKKGCNPIESMIDALQEAESRDDTAQALYIADKLAPYYAPKLSSMKVDGEVTALTYEEKLKLLKKAKRG